MDAGRALQRRVTEAISQLPQQLNRRSALAAGTGRAVAARARAAAPAR